MREIVQRVGGVERRPGGRELDHPLRVLATFRLTLMLVGEDSVTDYPNAYEYDERALLDDEDLSDMVLGEDAEREIDDLLRGL